LGESRTFWGGDGSRELGAKGKESGERRAERGKKANIEHRTLNIELRTRERTAWPVPERGLSQSAAGG
jgi:hypothetical protein